MTAACSGGTSAPKIGTSLVSAYSEGRAAQLLIGAGLSELNPAIPLLAAIPIIASTFCASDPPALPTFTAGETDAILNLKVWEADFGTGLPKLAALLANLFWYDLCTCTSGTLVPLAPPALPSTTQVNILPAPTPVAACATFTYTDTSGVSNGGHFNKSGPGYVGVNPTSFVYTAFNHILVGSGAGTQLSFTQVSYANVDLLSTTLFLAIGGTSTITVNAAPGVASIRLDYYGTSGTGNSSCAGSKIDAYCGGQTPGGTQAACCPPDAATQAVLDLILSYVTLIQRQLAPFAYLVSTCHSALSGNGTIAVSGLLGVQVDVTTLPSRAGMVVGSPNTNFDLGWVNLGTADGFGPRQFIGADPTLILPISPAVTVIGYSIPADVVVTICELVREF